MSGMIDVLMMEWLWWLPITVFVVFMIAAGFAGYINGWKSSVYFLIVNTIGSIVAITVMESFRGYYDTIELSLFLPFQYLGPVSALAVMVFIMFLGIVVYGFIRKKLKRTMKKNQQLGFSVAGSRMMGVGIWQAAALPQIVLAVNAVSIFTTPTLFSEVNDVLVKGTTLGRAEGISNDIEEYKEWAAFIIEEQEAVYGLQEIFRADKDNINEETKDALVENFDTLEKFLNSERMINSFEGFWSNQNTEFEYVDITNDIPKDFTGDLFGTEDRNGVTETVKFEIDGVSEARPLLYDFIKNTFVHPARREETRADEWVNSWATAMLATPLAQTE